MAFIPQEDEDSNEVGMNVLAGQEQTIQQPVEQQAQQPDQQVSGGQSASIEGGQPLGSQAQPTAPTSKKQRGSGMFTDIRKYIQANKPAGGRLGSAVAKGIQKKAQTPAQKLAEQSARIRQNYAAQQQALGQAQQATQQAGQQAGQLVNQQELQAQQERLQTRVGALGNLKQGGYQQDITGQQQAFQAFAPQIEQAQQAQQQATQAYQQAQQAQQQAQQSYQDFLAQSPIAGQQDPTQIRQFMMSRMDDPNLGQQYQQLQQNLSQQEHLARQAQQEQQARQQALQSLQGQQTAAQTQLQNLQDQQTKYERQQDLLGQISGIESQLGTQGTLDPSNMQQIRNFLSGDQTFDVGTLNTLEAKTQADKLAQQAMDLETKGDIRKRLLRETFGDKYTRGMSGLDDIILARTGQIGKLQEASKQAAGDIREDVSEAQAERIGLREDLLGQAEGARSQSQEALEAQLAGMMENLEQRAETGESGRLGELRQALISPEGLSQQQLEMLGGEQKLYGLDLQDAFQKAIEGQKLKADDVATATEKARIDAVRQLLGQDPTQMSTVQPGEFSTAERNVFENIKQQIADRESQYSKASSRIVSDVTSPWGEIAKPIAGELAGFAERGEMPSDAQLMDIQSRNYWTHAGQGRHGWVLPIQDMKAMINRMRSGYQQLNENMNIQGNKLRGFTAGEAAEDGLIKRNALRRLAKRG